MANNLFHYQDPKTLTAFRITSPTADVNMGIDTGVETYDYVFSYPATFNYQEIDLQSVHHREAKAGSFTQSEPRFITRFAIKWNVATVADIIGGVIVDPKDVEFLKYLDNYKHTFAVGGASKLEMILNYDDRLTFITQIESTFDVVMVGSPSFRHVGTEMMEASAVFETAVSSAKRKYVMVSNRTTDL